MHDLADPGAYCCPVNMGWQNKVCNYRLSAQHCWGPQSRQSVSTLWKLHISVQHNASTAWTDLMASPVSIIWLTASSRCVLNWSKCVRSCVDSPHIHFLHTPQLEQTGNTFRLTSSLDEACHDPKQPFANFSSASMIQLCSLPNLLFVLVDAWLHIPAMRSRTCPDHLVGTVSNAYTALKCMQAHALMACMN